MCPQHLLYSTLIELSQISFVKQLGRFNKFHGAQFCSSALIHKTTKFCPSKIEVLSSMPLCTPSLNKSKLPVYFITWKNKTDITSAADAQEVGWLQNGPPNKTLTHVVQKMLPRLCSSCLFYTVNAQLICNVLQFLNLFWRSHDDLTARRKQPKLPNSRTAEQPLFTYTGWMITIATHPRALARGLVT